MFTENKRTHEQKLSRFNQASSISHGYGNMISFHKLLALRPKEQWLLEHIIFAFDELASGCRLARTQTAAFLEMS
jgi:hypothetical protein